MSSVAEKRRVLTIGGQRDELASRSTVRISVQDLGGGIKLENMKHIFEAFYSTKPQGLGLRISLSIVEATEGVCGPRRMLAQVWRSFSLSRLKVERPLNY
jgi:C4-dicarboxylate-specific signal transduction histidine kinase